jgi:ketosteroid isomerase-like protein
MSHFCRRVIWVLGLLLLGAVSFGQNKTATPSPSRTTSPKAKSDNFDSEIQRIRETWVREFNAGHADKVTEFYAPEAVLMRWDGSVHGKDSILAEMQRSISGGAHDYVVHSLHTEHSGDLGYDTGAYNVTLRDRVVEGNYVIVVKRIKGKWLIVAHASVPNPRTTP